MNALDRERASLQQQLDAAQLELQVCRGDPWAADPSKWGHASQLEILHLQLVRLRTVVRRYVDPTRVAQEDQRDIEGIFRDEW